MTILLDYTLTPLARVSVGRSAQVDNDRRIHEAIPGATVRGALGTAWWRSPAYRYAGADPQPAFDRLFAAALQVGPAIPVRPGEREQARLVPLSWVTCKYPQEGCSDTWHDEVAGARRVCPTCHGPLKSGRGWSVPQGWSVSTTRTALTRGVSADEQLYSRRALRDNGMHLRGTIRVRDADGIAEAVQWLTAAKEIGIGGQLSTMGRCRWTCAPAAAADDESGLPAGDYALRLWSSAILLDELGAPTLDLAGHVDHVVRRAGGVARVGITRTRPVSISGWHGIAGLPKPDDWAVEAGSVVALHEADTTALRVLQDGVGIRRLEGYGMVSLVPIAAVQRDNAPEDHGLTIPAARVSSAAPAAGWPRHTESVVPHDTPPPTPARAVTVPQEIADEAPPLGPVEQLLGTIPEAGLRAKTVKGMLAQARNLMRMRDNGFPAAYVRGKVDEAAGLPWMRDLAGPTQQAVLDILGSDELPAHIETLQRMMGGAR